VKAPADEATAVVDLPSQAVRAVRSLARASRILERASGELNLAHYRVLAAIASGDERASRVAVRLALGKPAVSAAVDSLCQRGLLARTGVDADQRAATLSLTQEGAAVLERVEAEMTDRILALCARLPDGERVVESLSRLGDALDQAATERVPRGGGA
jgi:DNA-binding MarR family transcriptional regulator